MPGTKTMAARKAAIRHEYVETANGGRVNIFTSNRETLDAVHEFLKFQIAEHKTGDFHHRTDSVKGAPMGPRDVASRSGCQH